MSTNPTSGLTGYTHDSTLDNNPNTTNEKGGVIPTVLSYVGLGGGNNGTSSTSDATAEPAFGASVGPGHSNSSSAGGLGSTSTTGTGILGGSNTGSGLSGGDGYGPAPTLNPHDEDRARVVADRALGSTTGAGAGGYDSGVGSGLASGHHGSGVGSGVGLGSGSSAGLASGVGSGLDSDRHGSGVGSGVGLTSGQHGSGVGSGLDSDRHGSGVGSGVGLGSGHESGHHGSGVGSGVGLSSSDQDRHGSSELHHGSTSGDNSHKPPVTGGTKGSLENKSAIPTAGGVKLGEKHWGESDIVPENPKPREEENISSASGQPDQSTRDNTSANTGSSTIPSSGAGEHGEQGEHKEGLMDKVKHKVLHK